MLRYEDPKDVKKYKELKKHFDSEIRKYESEKRYYELESGDKKIVLPAKKKPKEDFHKEYVVYKALAIIELVFIVILVYVLKENNIL